MLKKTLLLTTLAASVALVGCDDDSASAPAGLSGTAAVGAPIVGGTVTARCVDADTDVTAVTSTSGKYTILGTAIKAAGGVAPCALKVAGGTVNGAAYADTLYSIAERIGTTNITPLTNLAVAKAAAGGGLTSPADFFDDTITTPIDVDAIIAQLDAAQAALEAELKEATGKTSVPFNIFTTSFAADGKSAYDVWLDSLQEALTDAGISYSSLLTGFATGGTFPVITIDVTPITGGGGTTGTLTVSVKVAGISQVVTSITGVPRPASQSEFCGGTGGWTDYASTGFTITSCTYVNGTGTLSGTVSGMAYQYVYKWS